MTTPTTLTVTVPTYTAVENFKATQHPETYADLLDLIRLDHGIPAGGDVSVELIEADLADDTAKADDAAVAAGLCVADDGQYPALVWQAALRD